MASRIRMGTLAEIPPGRAIEKQIMARKIAVFNYNGRLIGMESECKHMRASLARGGAISGHELTCAWHGWKYDIETGECTTNPGFKLKTYQIEIENDIVYLILP